MIGPQGLPLGRLGLTEEQRTRVRELTQSRREELQAIGERERTAREALRQAVTAETVDEGLVRARAAELAVVEADAAVAQARLYAEIFQMLTPEQQTRARELQAQMQERARERR
jgi:Spy/CpxP family protein refolding chaperone